MFHVEHEQVRNWFSERAANISECTVDRLIGLSMLIHETNSDFNLTGHKTPYDITFKLVLPSLDPFLHVDVPRGTRMIDIGTGAGIPGLPFCIYHAIPESSLVDSNAKKTAFISDAGKKLSISGLTVICSRAEVLGRDPVHRGNYGLALSRALASPYVSLELAAPFLSIGGFFYVYANDSWDGWKTNLVLSRHVADLGLAPVSCAELIRLKYPGYGYLFTKISETPQRFPRRFAAIKHGENKMLNTNKLSTPL